MATTFEIQDVTMTEGDMNEALLLIAKRDGIVIKTSVVEKGLNGPTHIAMNLSRSIGYQGSKMEVSESTIRGIVSTAKEIGATIRQVNQSEYFSF